MKKITIAFSLLGLIAGSTGCTKEGGVDEDLSFLNTAKTENNNTVIQISNDNSGNVMITPTSEGAAAFVVNFGHGTGAGASANVLPGNMATHVYPEGNYTVTIVSKDVVGKETSNTYPLKVTYRAPENIEPTIEHNANSISVQAKALYAD